MDNLQVYMESIYFLQTYMVLDHHGIECCSNSRALLHYVFHFFSHGYCLHQIPFHFFQFFVVEQLVCPDDDDEDDYFYLLFLLSVIFISCLFSFIWIFEKSILFSSLGCDRALSKFSVFSFSDFFHISTGSLANDA